MGSAEYLALAQALSTLREELQARALFTAQPALALNQSGFIDVPIDLSAAGLAAGGGGLQVPYVGYQVSYLRRGSTPGGLLQIAVGGMDRAFGPGDRLDAYFTELLLKSVAGSAAAGTALLRIALQPQAKFFEGQVGDVPLVPVALLGAYSPTAGPSGFITVAKDTDPSGATPTGSFVSSGWSRLVLLIDTTSNAGTATTFDLVPWYQALGSNTWFEQGTERVPVPDTDTSGGQFRVVVVDVSRAAGKMYFSVRNLLAAARTGLQFVVLGVG